MQSTERRILGRTASDQAKVIAGKTETQSDRGSCKGH